MPRPPSPSRSEAPPARPPPSPYTPAQLVRDVAGTLSLHDALGVLDARYDGWRLLEVLRAGTCADLVVTLGETFLVISVSESGAVREALLLDARPNEETLRAVRRDPSLRNATVLSAARTLHYDACA